MTVKHGASSLRKSTRDVCSTVMATPTERHIATMSYVSYLKAVNKNSSRLLEGARATLENSKSNGTAGINLQVVLIICFKGLSDR